jgi:hypothetical protein
VENIAAANQRHFFLGELLRLDAAEATIVLQLSHYRPPVHYGKNQRMPTVSIGHAQTGREPFVPRSAPGKLPVPTMAVIKKMKDLQRFTSISDSETGPAEKWRAGPARHATVSPSFLAQV